MSVIGVKGIPKMWNYTKIVRHLANIIKGYFEAIYFDRGLKDGAHLKCYLSLSRKLDPIKVKDDFNKNCKLPHMRAFIPAEMPKIPPETKRKKIPLSLRRALRISDEAMAEDVVVTVFWELFREIISKYSGLYKISEKSEHKLFYKIAKNIADRLIKLGDKNSEFSENYCLLSSAYRKEHPHSSDFDLIKKCVHETEEELGQIKTDMVEADFLKYSDPSLDSDQFAKLVSVSDKYKIIIAKQVSEHIESLDTETKDTDSMEEVAQKKVRTELKKVNIYIDRILQQVITKHMTPNKNEILQLCVYGEPFIPELNIIKEFFKKCHVQKYFVSYKIHNQARVWIPANQFNNAMALDSTVLKGAKLIIRPLSQDYKKFKTPVEILNKLAKHYGGEYNAEAMEQNDNDGEMEDAHDSVEEL